MMRHTGDYLLGTIFLAAALILQLSQAYVQSATLSTRIDGITVAASNGLPANSRSAATNSAVGATSSPAVSTVLTNLPQGTRVVVGSLDLSGARHQLQLTSRNDAPSNRSAFEVARFTTESIERLQRPETIRHWSYRARSDRDRALVQTAAFELQPEDTTLLSNISNAVYRPTSDTATSNIGLLTSIQTSPTSTAAGVRSPRMFLIPHFSNNRTIHEPGECLTIAESQRIQVYVDQSLPQASSHDQLRVWSGQLIPAVELIALPIVETWIGSVCDIDHNEKLSIVITDLDQHENRSAGQSPIFGCIRESDFCPESDFCGDVVYIDQTIFELPSAEVNALLTHEIAHAAICSMDHEVSVVESANSSKNRPFFAKSATTPIQPWLNEAVAHFVELQCCGEANVSSQAAQEFFTENFQRRIDAFLADSSVSPIVASETVLNLEERRSGSRGAATLFLAPLISTPRDLQKLLRSDASLKVRIEDLAQQPLADVFRNWTLAISSITNDRQCLSVEKIDANVQRKHCSLLGTAFYCFECSDDIATLVLTSDELAQLQVSIIEPAISATGR